MREMRGLISDRVAAGKEGRARRANVAMSKRARKSANDGRAATKKKRKLLQDWRWV